MRRKVAPALLPIHRQRASRKSAAESAHRAGQPIDQTGTGTTAAPSAGSHVSPSEAGQTQSRDTALCPRRRCNLRRWNHADREKPVGRIRTGNKADPAAAG